MELQDVGITPVSPDKPAGSDPGYEPEFEQLQAEIDRLSAPSADGQGVDWDKVVALSRTILEGKGKHLQTAGYLAVALMKKNGLQGLGVGAKIFSDVVTTFWDDLWPAKNRMRGRVNAIGWYKEQVQAFVSDFTTDAAFPKDFVDGLARSFDSLDAFLADKVPDAPSFRELARFASMLPVEAAPAAPAGADAATGQATDAGQGPGVQAGQAGGGGGQTAAPGQAARPAAQAAARPAAAPPKPAAPAPADDPEAWAKFAQQQMIAAAGVLLSKDVTDPRAYLLSRWGAWLSVDGPPPAEKGQTMIPPPDSAIAGALGQLVAGGQFEEAARQAESLLPAYLFWFDLSWVSAQALESSGAKGRAALEVVKAQTGLYAARVKGVENMTFSDGTPFARPATKAWLKTIEPGASGPAAAAAEGSVLAKTMAEAETLAATGKFLDAVTALQAALAQTHSGRERFDALIAMSSILSRAGRPDLAGPNVDELLGLVDQYRLEQWEPDTALRGLLAAYEVLSLDTSEEGKARARQVLSRVARVNPAAAMRVSG
jgi:type VI secretion system protein VasJ